MVPPKKIAPLLALVSMLMDAAKTLGTLFVIVKEFAVMFAPILTLPLPPDADETWIVPSLVVAPTAPVKVIIPLVPAFKVRV